MSIEADPSSNIPNVSFNITTNYEIDNITTSTLLETSSIHKLSDIPDIPNNLIRPMAYIMDRASDYYSTIHLSTPYFLLKSEKRGRTPGKFTYDIVNYNSNMYVIVSLPHKKETVKFVIDYCNLSKIIDKPWHLSSGKYIATNYTLEDGTCKELYLHNFLMGKTTDAEDNENIVEKEYVIHINNNLLDNRMENLRVVDSTDYYHGKSKRKRIITLPTDCGFTPDEIPKYILYVKSDGKHGDRFTIEIPRLQIFRKLTSSKKISLKEKLENAITELHDIYKMHPEVDANREDSLKKSLLDSFNTILSSNTIENK